MATTAKTGAAFISLTVTVKLFALLKLGEPLSETRTEIVYVLTGTGTCYIGDRSYPVGPGAAFRIGPGAAHSAIPADGETIVAISYFEPPLDEGDDRIAAD